MIAYGEADSPDIEGNYHIGSEFGRYIHAAKARIFDSAGFESKLATRRLINKLMEYKPDVVHLHNLHGYYINIGILFKYLSEERLPVVWTLHDCWSFTGHCSHFSQADCYLWKTKCHNCPQKHEYPKSILADNSRENYRRKREIIKSIDNLTIIVPSQWLRKTVEQSFLSERPIIVIPNGINFSIFKKLRVILEVGMD